MKNVDLAKVLDLLIAEDRDAASAMLHEWFVGKSKSILEELMSEDDALDSINDDKDEIEAEEYYGDADLNEAGEEEDAVAALADIADIADEVLGGEGDDFEVDEADEDGIAGDDFGGEEVADVDGDMDAMADAGDDLGGEMDAEMPIEDKVDDLEAQLAALKAEFDELMGIEGGEEEVAGDEEVVGEDVELSEGEEIEETEEVSEGEELDEDFADLEESFQLETVKDPDMSEGSEAGDGGKVAVSTKSPIPQRKTGDRVGGAVVEIKGKTHKGYEREAAPAVNKKPLLKNQVNNAKEDLKPVSPKGDTSALLNKEPAKDKGKSPIGGGAVDLRGDDMKRKK